MVRQSVILLLDSAIDELRQIEDIRARVLMAETIVKLLGKSNPEHCHSMLDSLFDAALQLQKVESADKPQNSKSDIILEKIIQIAAKLDRKFAEKYIDQYTASKASNGHEPSAPPELSPERAIVYMRLATDLLENDPVLALSVAERSLRIAVPPETLVFLATLRKKDVAQASTMFGVALNNIKLRRGLDINELLLLYSYVFSPMRVPVFSSQGLAVFNIPTYRTITMNYSVDAGLAKQYLTTAMGILLDEQRYYPGNIQRLTNGLEGDFCLIRLIEAAASSYVPELLDSISTQRHILAGYMRPEVQVESGSSVDRWNTMPQDVSAGSRETNATLDYLLQRAEQISDPKRKDQLYYRAAVVAASTKGADAAFEIVDKMSLQYREKAKEFIAFDIALKAARKHQLAEAESLARRDSDLTRRSYIFTVIAGSLLDDKNRDAVGAMEFINEIERLAAKLDTDSEKVAVLVGAAAVASRLDAARAADLLRQAIRIANKIEGFSVDTRVPRSLDVGGGLFAYTMYDGEFTLVDAVIRLGTNDFNQTVGDINGFKNRLPRLQTIVALCDGILSQNSRP